LHGDNFLFLYLFKHLMISQLELFNLVRFLPRISKIHLNKSKWKLEFEVKLKHCQNFKFQLGCLFMQLALNFFKLKFFHFFCLFAFNPWLLIYNWSFLVDKPFIFYDLRMAVFNLGCNIVSHCSSKEHRELSKGYFSRE